MRIRRLVLTLAVLLGIFLNLAAAPAQAQTEPAAADAALANYGVRCQDGQCTLTVDAGGIKAEVPVPNKTPLAFDLPAGNLGFLSGAGIEISDRLTLKLPVGDVQIRTGAFEVGLDETGKVERLHGRAETVLPNLTLPNNLRVGGNFPAEFGYDVGAQLGNVSHLLDPEQHYLFLRLGEGFTLDTALPDENGKNSPISVAIPDNESTTLIIDPENQVLYLDGRFNLSQVLKLAVVGGMLGIDVGQLPMLSGLALPLRSTVGVAALFSRDPERNFVELNGDLGIQGGPLSRLLQLGDTPLLLDSTIHIDRGGLKLQGVVDASLAPNTLLQSGGTVEVYVPFERLSDAYVRLGGNLSVPILGIAASNETTLGGAQGGDAAEIAATQELSWWDEASAWIGGAASSTASGVASGAQTGVNAMQSAVDAALSSAGAAASNVKTPSAGSTLSGAAAGVNCGVNKAQQLWCQTTGLCEPPEDACPPAEGSGN